MKIILLAFALANLSTFAAGRSSLQKPIANPGTGRIIGGNDAEEGFAPYQVSIQNVFGEHICGGSIIDNYWILTAGHCLDWPIEYLFVATGSAKWEKPDAVYEIKEAKLHCLYNQPWNHNDIALFRLSKPIVYNKLTQPIALASSNTLKDGDTLTLTGWGGIKVWGKTPENLQKVTLKYVTNSKCVSSVKIPAGVGNGHICSSTSSGTGACNGDSGGPLVANGVQVGIVNWGEACAVGTPDVYAGVAYYHDWIRSTIAGKNTC